MVYTAHTNSFGFYFFILYTEFAIAIVCTL